MEGQKEHTQFKSNKHHDHVHFDKKELKQRVNMCFQCFKVTKHNKEKKLFKAVDSTGSDCKIDKRHCKIKAFLNSWEKMSLSIDTDVKT